MILSFKSREQRERDKQLLKQQELLQREKARMQAILEQVRSQKNFNENGTELYGIGDEPVMYDNGNLVLVTDPDNKPGLYSPTYNLLLREKDGGYTFEQFYMSYTANPIIRSSQHAVVRGEDAKEETYSSGDVSVSENEKSDFYQNLHKTFQKLTSAALESSEQQQRQ